jgi:hypothetical protein
MEDEEEQIYWRNRPCIGYIFEDTWKEIKNKAWERIKMNYMIDHLDLLMKHLPFFIPNNPPTAISISYSPYPRNNRIKWKTMEQFYHNFKFRWRKEINFFFCKSNTIIKEFSTQAIYNPLLIDMKYHKYNGAKPNLENISILLINPQD